MVDLLYNVGNAVLNACDAIGAVTLESTKTAIVVGAVTGTSYIVCTNTVSNVQTTKQTNTVSNSELLTVLYNAKVQYNTAIVYGALHKLHIAQYNRKVSINDTNKKMLNYANSYLVALHITNNSYKINKVTINNKVKGSKVLLASLNDVGGVVQNNLPLVKEINLVEKKHGLCKNTLVTEALIESHLDTSVGCNKHNACGMLQFIPSTGKIYGLNSTAERNNYKLNLEAGAKLAKDNIASVGSNAIHLVYIAHQQGVNGVKNIYNAMQNNVASKKTVSALCTNIPKDSMYAGCNVHTVNGKDVYTLAKGYTPRELAIVYMKMWKNEIYRINDEVNKIS